MSAGRKLQMDVYDVYRPAFLLCRALGLAPMRMRRVPSSGHWGLSLSTPARVYGVVLLMVAVPLVMAGVLNDLCHTRMRIKNVTSAVVTTSDVMGVALTAVVAVLHLARWRSGKSLVRLLEKLADVDCSLGCERQPRGLVLGVTCAVLSHMLLLVGFDGWCWYAMSDRHLFRLNYVPLYALHVVVAVFELHFVVVCSCLHSSFRNLNQQLASLLAGRDYHLTPIALPVMPSQGRPRHVGVHKEGSRRLDALFDLHAVLCDAVELSNSLWGVPLLVDFLSILLHLTITPYFFLLDLIYPKTYGSRDPSFLVLQVLWTATHIFKLVFIVRPCSATHHQAKQTGVLVSKYLNQKLDPANKKQLKMFALQLLHRNAELSICGMYVIDSPLIMSIAGSVTTYLVILMQFQLSDHD